MSENFVYIDLKNNRLTIVSQAIDSKDFFELMSNKGEDRDLCLAFCKMFCIGYMIGSGNKSPINDINEFK